MGHTLHLLDLPAAPEIRRSARHDTDWPSAHSGMSGLLQLMAAPLDDLHMAGQVPVASHQLHAGETLFAEGAPAQAIYFVRGGTFKTYSTAADGYEQVLGFTGRAELLGFEALSTGRHPAAAAALEPASVYAILLPDLFHLAHCMPPFNRMLLQAASDAMSYRGERSEVMEAVAADVRLARFLLHLSRRMAACNQSPRRFHLRMGRRDIASYLGVAHETVSRSFSALASWGWIGVRNREVEILDMPALAAFSGSARRHAEEAPTFQHSLCSPLTTSRPWPQMVS